MSVGSAPAARGGVTGVGSAPAARVRRRRSKRWIRAAAPFAVLAAFWAVTLVAHAFEEPNLDEAGTLSPTGAGPDGSSRLADMLGQRGIIIERVGSGREAIQAAATADSTIFVPAPDYLNPRFQSFLTEVFYAHRVVVVQPGLRSMLLSPVPIFRVGERWATDVVAPRCQTPYAVKAGPAAVLHDYYVAEGRQVSADCYGGGLVGVREGDTEFIYIGASDPFRNGRIDEAGNAALATGLLSEFGRVVWIDVHQTEPVSRSPVDVPNPELPQYRRGNQDRTNTGFPTIDAFPPALWAVIVLGLVAAVLLALARARRLGPPVAEPLPVLVPAAEAVTGRGRLYQRIAARDATMGALRGAAISRIARVVNPFGGPAAERDLIPPRTLHPSEHARTPAVRTFVEQVAARTGTTEDRVAAILYGAIPQDDGGLVRAVADLDQLVAAALRENPPAATTDPDHDRGGPQ
jgi:hypothetical protein